MKEPDVQGRTQARSGGRPYQPMRRDRRRPSMAVGLALLGLATVSQSAHASDVSTDSKPALMQPRVAPMLVVVPLVEVASSGLVPFFVLAGPPDALSPRSLIRISGLPAGVKPSEGKLRADGSWDIPLAAALRLKLRVPDGLSGRTEFRVTLVDGDGMPAAERVSALVIGANLANTARLPDKSTEDVRAAASSRGDSEEDAKRADPIRKDQELRLAALAKRLDEVRLEAERAEAEWKAEQGRKDEAEARAVAEKAEARAVAEKAEAARLAEEARKAQAAREVEVARLAEEARKAEAARLAEEARKAQEAKAAAEKAEGVRLAEEARKVEAARKAEDARLAEEARKAQEAKAAAEKADAARLAEEVRKAEAARKAEDARLAEEARKAQEAKAAAERAEAVRLAEEARKAEAARKAEEARLAEEARKVQEAKAAAEKAEAARLAEEARKVEAARKAEAARLAEEARKAQAKAAAEKAEAERKIEHARLAEAEAARLAEEGRQALEAARAAAEKAVAARQAEQARLAEEARKAEEVRLAAAVQASGNRASDGHAQGAGNSASVATEPSKLESAQTERLVTQGEQFLAQGNIVVARQYFLRAARAANPLAALKLAETYDPRELDRIGVFGVKADVAQAQAWYQRALELGAAEAQVRLQRLAGQ